MNCYPVHSARLPVRLPPSFLGMDDLTYISFDSQATWVIDVFDLFLWCVNCSCLYKQALTDVWSTGAGIICPYRTVLSSSWTCRTGG